MNATEPVPIPCALYTRVSSRGQVGGEYDSLTSQKDRLEAYVRSQENLSVFRVYVDSAQSGDTLDRPAIQEMLRDIRDGRIKRVVAYKIDRLLSPTSLKPQA